LDSQGEIFVMTKTDGYVRKLVGLDAPNQLILRVDPVTGEAMIENGSAAGTTIDGYSILSSSGSLRTGDAFWHSLTDQGTSGWVEASPETNALSELSPQSQLPLSGGGKLSLGTPFNTAGTPDLTFEYQVVGYTGSSTGIVMYGSLLPGDFNRDGDVDAVDYVVWRDKKGQQIARGLAADGNGDGFVDVSDYQLWTANFGRSASGSGTSAVGSVPEPGSLIYVLLLLAAFIASGKKRDRAC
jgi:hypothetical protein